MPYNDICSLIFIYFLLVDGNYKLCSKAKNKADRRYITRETKAVKLEEFHYELMYRLINCFYDMYSILFYASMESFDTRECIQELAVK